MHPLSAFNITTLTCGWIGPLLYLSLELQTQIKKRKTNCYKNCRKFDIFLQQKCLLKRRTSMESVLSSISIWEVEISWRSSDHYHSKCPFLLKPASTLHKHYFQEESVQIVICMKAWSSLIKKMKHSSQTFIVTGHVSCHWYHFQQTYLTNYINHSLVDVYQ